MKFKREREIRNKEYNTIKNTIIQNKHYKKKLMENGTRRENGEILQKGGINKDLKKEWKREEGECRIVKREKRIMNGEW